MSESSQRIYCNRTLNLRSIKAIGYDMDYTLIHYRTDAWEGRAYDHVRRGLEDDGFPTQDLTFDPEFVIRGLVVDTELGNLVKANRFGYEKRGFHGTRSLDYDEMRSIYARTIIDLSEPRFRFLNTLFSLSEASLYAQLVDRLDAGAISGVLGYRDLYKAVRTATDHAHVEGKLKAEILASPDDYVESDPQIARAARSVPGRQEAHAHHELGLVVHRADDAVRVRPPPAAGHELARSLHARDRGRAEAGLLPARGARAPRGA